MARPVIDRTWFQWGDLLALRELPSAKGKNALWLCRCKCNRDTIIGSHNIGRQISCIVCRTKYQRSKVTTHGLGASREYKAWHHAKRRCYDASLWSYKYYGGRGITMCEEWKEDVAIFFRDMGPCPNGYSLERIDVNGNYEPSNCKWIPKSEQPKNRRSGLRNIVILLFLILATPIFAQTITTPLKLSWVDNASNEEGFIIYRDNAQIAKVGANIVTYNDTVTGNAGQRWCYEVTAFNYSQGSGKGTLQESAKSNTACYTVPAPVPPPNAPSGLTAERVSSGSTQTSWALNNPPGTVSVILTRDQTKPAKTNDIALDVDVDSYVDAGLVKSKTYCYRVRAVNAAGVSGYSNQSCATTR